MTIGYAILGLLSWKPLSGYDLKKLISESDLFYWSGNNNQIYNSLVRLHQDSFVTQQVQPQESRPPRKIYSITEKGREALRKWVQSNVELPELRNTFLIQLAWADQLTGQEIDALLGRYEEELEDRLRIQQEKARRGGAAPLRTEREAFLWEKISENMRVGVQNELDWTRQVRKELRERWP